MDFPDIGHLRQLQKDLWNWPKSRAALMVGAGFSLNAKALPGVTKSFSTWRQLARAMFDQLHPLPPVATPEQKQTGELRFSNSNPLRLASEYEAAFDRRKLELLIQEQNPDSDYEPGPLHSLLLELPWADVFTTNYDTLLERTEVLGRTYQPVSRIEELTTASSPRILKLHGSFPSQTPFIISEEDYRTYPRRFAPFVNSVQQALLENSMVLLGFSGDDPNFIEWSGWIRDELGDNHAPVYLVGPLSLGHAERSLLARRGVTPIDLSPVFAGFAPPNGIHPSSLEWFLRSLAAAQPPRPEKWPDLQRPRQANPVGCPATLAEAVIAPQQIDLSPRVSLDIDKVKSVVERWRFERRNYPGWLILAQDKRSSLWEHTKYWIEPMAVIAKDWPITDRLRLFREINWRLETALVPLFTPWIEHFERALDQALEPLVAGSRLPPALVVADADEDMRDVWLELAFALLREARETYNADRWGHLKRQIDRLLPQRPQHTDRAQYEAALWAMWNGDRVSAKALTDGWQPPAHLPSATMWKGAILAELDDLGEARTVLRTALTEIRRAVKNHGKNIQLLSLEGWCTYVLCAVETALDPRRYDAIRNEFWERWQELKVWDCSPWPHRDYFEQALVAPLPKVPKEEEEVRGFDPGDVTTSVHWTGDHVGRFLPAFACIRFHEQAAVPMRLRSVDISGETLQNACLWIAPFITFWSPALLIRAGRVGDLRKGEFLGRTHVATMSPEVAQRVYSWSLEIFERELKQLTGYILDSSGQEALLEALPEVLSRLAFRVDIDQLRRTFPLVLQFHRQAAVRAHIRLHEASKPWFRRLFHAAGSELLLEWLPALIRAPLFDEGTPALLPQGESWPDPMRHFPRERVREAKDRSPEPANKVHEATDWLLRRAASESGECRQRALLRLTDVYHAKLMTAEQEEHLGQLLWEHRAANGLPNLQNFAAFGFLHLPAPPNVDVAQTIKNYILSLDSRGFVVRDGQGRASISVGSFPRQRLIYEVSLASKPVVELRGEALGGIGWSSEESKQLYSRAREWWSNDKVAFDIAGGGAFFGAVGIEPVRSTLESLADFLSRAVLPTMHLANESEWMQLEDWLHELRSFGAFPTVALPYILLQRRERVNAVARIISEDLSSESSEACSAAAKALRHWLHLFDVQLAPKPPSELLTALVERTAFRRKPGILACLSQLTYLIVDKPDMISHQHANLLLGSLMPWHDATILPAGDRNMGEFEAGERADLRVFLGRLAGALKIWNDKQTTTPREPEPLSFWQQACASDPLPEVRRAFRTWDHLTLR